MVKNELLKEVTGIEKSMKNIITALGDVQVLLVKHCKAHDYDFFELFLEAQSMARDEENDIFNDEDNYILKSVGLMLFNTQNLDLGNTKTRIILILRHVVDVSRKLGVTAEYCFKQSCGEIPICQK